MSLRVCAEPGCPMLVKSGRCQQHKRESPTWHAGNKRSERRRRVLAIADHRALYGDWCPGYGVAAHPSADLTADHVVAVANGGADGGLRVLCRSCNSRKGAR